MEDNNEFVLDNTENVEQVTEELVDGAKTQETTEEVVNTVDDSTLDTESVEEKIYTKKQYQDKITDNAKRMERRLRKEYEDKYGYLRDVLKAGTGIEDAGELADTFANFYTSKGKAVPKRNDYVNKYDMEAGAEREANEIIKSSWEEVVSETDRLAQKGLDNMNPRETLYFQHLATYRQNKERENELLSIGVNKEVLENENFINFAKQFNSDVPIKQVHEYWTKTQPTKKVEQMGSMKNTVPNKVKDYYTEEEISKLSLNELVNNDELWEYVRNSMTEK